MIHVKCLELQKKQGLLLCLHFLFPDGDVVIERQCWGPKRKPMPCSVPEVRDVWENVQQMYGRGEYSPRWEPGNNTRSWREQKSLRTQGICIKGGFGRLVEVRKLGTKEVVTTKGRRKTTRASPKGIHRWREGREVQWVWVTTDWTGGFRVCYVFKSQGKKAYLHLQCSELAQLPNLCRVNLWDFVIIQDKVKGSWRKRT